MLKNFINKAKNGDPVYISKVYEQFNNLPEQERCTIFCILELLAKDNRRLFKFDIPLLSSPTDEEMDFIKSYVHAQIYNILSSLGGRMMTIYIDKSEKHIFGIVSNLNKVFCINKDGLERKGYGRCINVLDRMLETLFLGEQKFKFVIEDISKLPAVEEEKNNILPSIDYFKKVPLGLNKKIVIGIDVGGTDIKAILVNKGKIQCFKEYDWFPTNFKLSKQLVDPICLIVRLLRAKLFVDEYHYNKELKDNIEKALDKNASDDFMENAVNEIEKMIEDNIEIDSIGLAFPDVVVRNKIVGGETYKTRGIRNNKEINYEKDFKQLTNLDNELKKYIKKDGVVKIINDGLMAAFTAAVEIAFSVSSDEIEKGIFAHTLGTELGTGWIMSDGKIPEIPLEAYNFIIDLGSYIEKKYEPDDLRSINNFNTGLPGTLQKYCSQSGIFRLALKYFPEERPDLFKKLIEKGFILERSVNGVKVFYVPTEPKDLRKPFLEFMITLAETENDETNKKIWRELGEFLAVAGLETKKILNPETNIRFLFGRLVKSKTCFNLICEGAERISKNLKYIAAGTGIANTILMKELEKNEHYTVAQFAQAIGAVYFANN